MKSLRNSTAVLLLAATSSLGFAQSKALGAANTQQEHSQWCWAATSSCILKVVQGKTTPQCEIVNYLRKVTTACGNTTFDWSSPINYPIESLYEPDKPSVQNVYAKYYGSTTGMEGAPTYAKISSEIEAGRPINMRWGWSSGGGHLLAVYGYDSSNGTQQVNYMDPWPGEGLFLVTYSWIKYGNKGGGASHTWTHALLLDPVNAELAISTQPSNVSVSAGSSASFTVAATGGTAPYAYQWSRNGTAVSGATSATYSLTAASTDSGAKFKCTVTDSASPAASVTSSEATLTVTTPAANLALKKSASASGTYSTYVPANAFDGVANLTNQTTYWAVSTSTKTQWLQVDLGAAQAVSKAKLTFSSTNYPKTYSIQYLNGSTWTSVYSTTTGKGGANSAVSFSPVTAQKWRIYCTAANSSYYSVYEFELYQ